MFLLWSALVIVLAILGLIAYPSYAGLSVNWSLHLLLAMVIAVVVIVVGDND